jgi:hypothetical protein
MQKYTAEQILVVMIKKGYVVFKDGSPNLIGIRSTDRTVNIFNDLLVDLRTKLEVISIKHYEITTDPGLYYLQHSLNPLGCAILKSGQYRKAWSIGKHRGLYTALVQTGEFTLIRDFDKDNELDFNTGREETGTNFGINCHHAGETDSDLIGKYSAGCQVFHQIKEWYSFINDMLIAKEKWGNFFTYTLLEEQDFLDLGVN